MKFTKNRIEELRCPPGKQDALFFDEDQKGLAVRVMAGGGKSFLCQYTLNGQRRRIPLGAFDAISLAAVREAVRVILGDVARGIDVAATRKAEAVARKIKEDALTFDALIREWETLHLVDRRERYAQEAVRALRNAFAKRLKLPAADLTRAQIVNVLDGLVADGRSAMASRVKAYGAACYSWAVKRGKLTGNPFEQVPTPGVKSRDRVLSDSELAEIWQATDPKTPFGGIVRTLILTAQRRDEVAGMTWDEISCDRKTWVIPGQRSKNRTSNIVPLSMLMIDLLDRPRIGDSAFVFPGRNQFNGFGKAKARLDADILAARKNAAIENGEDPEKVKPMPAWRLHDLRRTAATGLQRLGVRLEVTEAILNHVGGSRAGVVGIYQRHEWADEKRVALNAWATHILALGNPQTADNVVNLQRVEGRN